MIYYKTDKTTLNTEEIEIYIQKHLNEEVPRLNDLWGYYIGKNPTILKRKSQDPDNRSTFAYGRKIITTFTGYAYRPGYISYYSEETNDTESTYLESIENIFDKNNESIKTERSGRNTGIFGKAYELLYIDSSVDAELNLKAIPRFFNVDPREMVLLYDYSPEPKKAIAIRYYPINTTLWIVEYYTKDEVIYYYRELNTSGIVRYTIKSGPTKNLFGDVPVVAYYMGDECIGLIGPVTSLIDDYDLIMSDSMIEFSRFANAYLRMVGVGIGDPTNTNKDLVRLTLNRIKQMRVFDRLKAPDDVTFLTKDIPKEFIDFMTNTLKDQIHSLSHVPDFSSDKFAGTLSGSAIERLLFDFENVVSSAEADFNLGLYDRIGLISRVLAILGVKGEPTSISIAHKRNVPLDEKNRADTALVMKNTGFSSYAVASNMPREMIPDVDEELKLQQAEQQGQFNLDQMVAQEQTMMETGSQEGNREDTTQEDLNG